MKRTIYIVLTSLLAGMFITSCQGRTDKNVDTLNETVEVVIDTTTDSIPMVVQ